MDYFENNERVPITGFDYEAIDEALGSVSPVDHVQAEDPAEMLGEVMHQILVWLTTHDSTIHIKSHVQPCIKTIAFIWRTRPELLDGVSLREIARRFDIPVQRFSEAVIQFEKAFGLTNHEGRPHTDEEEEESRIGNTLNAMIPETRQLELI